MLTKEQILDAVVPWWAERLQLEEKREAFSAAFRKRLNAALYERDGGWHADSVSTDYDPQGPVLDALHDAGVECRGCMFSCDGVFPKKHRTIIRGSYVESVEGYGGKRTVIAGARED